jgi:hypothetical protein
MNELSQFFREVLGELSIEEIMVNRKLSDSASKIMELLEI